MNKSSTSLLLVTLLALGIGIGLLINRPVTVNIPPIDFPATLGATATDDANRYMNITSANASSTAGTVVCGGPCVLGSITINTTSAHVVRIYDGNSSATSTATRIGAIKASTVEQTLPYGVATSRGIVVETPAGYTGDITVSYR